MQKIYILNLKKKKTYAKNIGKIDKVFGIRIETIYNFTTRDKLSILSSI